MPEAKTGVFPEFGFVADRRTEEVKSSAPARRWGGSQHVERRGDSAEPIRWLSPTGRQVNADYGVRARMMVISDAGGSGFRVCGWCGWAAQVAGAPPQSHKHPVTDRPCGGRLQNVSMVHRYETDIAELTFDSLAYSKSVEDKWLSLLYALLEGASEALEISADDIDGTLSWTGDGRRSIALFDTVPAGAGAVKQIAENLGKVLSTANSRVADCDCGVETSCYGCLRSFRNAREHDRLSRAGAVDLLADLGSQR